MNGNNQPAVTDNAIPLVRERNVRVGDEPSIGGHLLSEGIGHGTIVMIGVDECDHDGQCPDDT